MAATRVAANAVDAGEHIERVLRDDHPATVAAFSLVRRASAMGLGADEPNGTLGQQLLVTCVQLNQHGLAGDLMASLGSTSAGAAKLSTGSSLVEVITRTHDALGDNPLPDTEWEAVHDTLGDTLSDLVGVSPTSVRRYMAGERVTPDAVAARLHFLALVNADLAAGYNGWGIRRWYRRHRSQLDGHSPADLLTGDWDPDDEGPRRVAQLARSLTAAGAT